jgi:hypothetical protein
LGTPSSGTLTNCTGLPNAGLVNSSVTVGSTSIALGATSTTLDGVNIGATTAGTGAFTTLSASSTVSGTGFSTYLASPPAIGGTAAAAGTFTTLTGSTSVTTPIVKSASSLTLQSNGTTTAVTIDTSQNVGIGTSPSSEQAGSTFLQVSASSSYSTAVLSSTRTFGDNFRIGTIAFELPNNTATYRVRALIDGNMTGSTANKYGGYLTFATAPDNVASPSERMRIDSSGNVGIGTSSPASKFHVSSTGAVPVQISSTQSSAYLQLNSSGGGSGIASNGDALTFFTSVNGTERARINSSGNVLIGCTATPSASVGGIQLQGGQSAQFIQTSALSTGGYDHWNLYNGNGLVGHVYTSSSSTTYATSSDYRLKENIAPMTGALDKIAQLKPVTYKWKVDGSDGQGFIAHELQAVVPDCVTGEKDAVETYLDDEGNEQTRIKPQGIDTSFLVATLTAAIQEAKALIDAQAETINALTARVVALEAK